jgi:hypothetical protein
MPRSTCQGRPASASGEPFKRVRRAASAAARRLAPVRPCRGGRASPGASKSSRHSIEPHFPPRMPAGLPPRRSPGGRGRGEDVAPRRDGRPTRSDDQPAHLRCGGSTPSPSKLSGGARERPEGLRSRMRRIFQMFHHRRADCGRIRTHTWLTRPYSNATKDPGTFKLCGFCINHRSCSGFLALTASEENRDYFVGSL